MSTVRAMQLLLSGMLAAASICSLAMGATLESYMYDDLLSGEAITVYPGAESVGVGESVFDAQVCGSDSKLRCFATHTFAFAVRKTGPCAPGTWTVDGRKYSVVAPLQPRFLLGRMQEVCRIESSITRGDETISGSYLYSPVDGLLVMEIRFREGAELRQRIYLARGTGFGAMTK